MKKIIGHILIIAILTLGVGTAFSIPRTAHAACSIGGVAVGNGLTDCINELVVVVIMPIIGKFLQISAYLFDQALTINMNIAQFLQKPNCTSVDCATSPVEVIWRLIRDISGMFFIFILIWASIKMILSGENNKSVIVGVIMAGLLVNFSLFATKIVIDASNSLTLTIYRAIAPGQADMTLYDSTVGGMSYNVYNYNNDIYGKDGTISSKIMQVVDLQSLFAATSQASKKTNFNVGSIVTVVGGISLMLVLGIAFLAAGAMFLWRFIMLLVLMAFSPIPALAYAFPQLRSKSADFIKHLVNQCVFAPLFLFFIYIALRVLTNKAFISLAGAEHSTFANVFGGVGANIAPLVQYGLVISVIFGGLFAAKDYGSKGADWGMNSITGLGKWTSGIIGRNTVGQAARGAGLVVNKLSTVEVGDPNSKFAKTGNFLAGLTGARVLTREGVKATRSGLKGIAGSKFGSSQSIEDVKKENKEYRQKQEELVRTDDFKDNVRIHLEATTDASHGDLKKALSKMNEKEIAKLGKKVLDKKLAAQLSKKQAEAILKSDEISDQDKDKFKQARTDGIADRAASFKYSDIEDILKEDFSEPQKDRIKEARLDALDDLITGKTTVAGVAQDELVIKAMENMGGKELEKYVKKAPPGAPHPFFTAGLKSSHLKDMEGLDSTRRKDIGNAISVQSLTTGVAHNAQGYVNKNHHLWT